MYVSEGPISGLLSRNMCQIMEGDKASTGYHIRSRRHAASFDVVILVEKLRSNAQFGADDSFAATKT